MNENQMKPGQLESKVSNQGWMKHRKQTSEGEEQVLEMGDGSPPREAETNPKVQFTFEEIFHQNKNRIHYQMQRLGIFDPHQEFYSEGLFAMWQAYKRHEPDKGPLATYFNYAIRNRLIDTIRKKTRDQEKDEIYIEQEKEQLGEGPALMEQAKLGQPIASMEKQEFWQEIKEQLTENQWNWVYYYIIQGMPLKEIAELKGVSLEAVKGWGKSARGKLRKILDE